MTEVKPTEEPKEEWSFDVDEKGRFLALLPSGKRPIIIPLLPATLRNIYSAFPQPEVPVELLPVVGSGMAQTLKKEDDPAYKKALNEWWAKTKHALLTRIVTDCLVVPEDADFVLRDKPYIAHPSCAQHRHLGNEAKWKRMKLEGEPSEECTCIPPEDDWSLKLRMAGMPVPQDGVERSVRYAQEALPEIFTDADEQYAIIEAVRQLTQPTEASIRAARERFQHALAGNIVVGDEDNGDEDTSEP